MGRSLMLQFFLRLICSLENSEETVWVAPTLRQIVPNPMACVFSANAQANMNERPKREARNLDETSFDRDHTQPKLHEAEFG